MKTVADVLGLSRSNLVERLKGRSKPCGSYLKAEDAELLPAIRRLVDAWPTCGYRRIAAFLNSQRPTADLGWCSDSLGSTCWNGEVVSLAFIIDAFDREIISWAAVANAGISGCGIET